MLKKIKSKLISLSGAQALDDIRNRLKRVEKLLEGVMIEEFIESRLEQDKYADPKSLSRYYRSVYSQNGEDGIIGEIFRRIGVENRFFVEFGVHGVDNNTTYLLHKGWQGLWVEGDAGRYDRLKKSVDEWGLPPHRLQLNQGFITAENFEEILKEKNVKDEFDLLSVDIDGNDYYVLASMNHYKPRVIVIEYNASFGASEDIVIEYDPAFRWRGGSYFGASLQAITIVAKEKGYSLVGCDLSGTNAFLVRNDLLGGHFIEPYTAERHYEPPRYFLMKPCGHAPAFGRFSWLRDVK